MCSYEKVKMCVSDVKLKMKYLGTNESRWTKGNSPNTTQTVYDPIPGMALESRNMRRYDRAVKAHPTMPRRRTNSILKARKSITDYRCPHNNRRSERSKCLNTNRKKKIRTIVLSK